MTLKLSKVPVQCRNIRLAYGATPVLKDVSLDIAPGEFFALLGPSGSGKSTLLRLIAGFNRHQHGQLLVDGKDISAVPPHRRNIGMVFQSYALWPHMNVHDNVAFGLVERRVPKAEIRRRVAEALETVGLTAYANRRPGQLSGGQQQRVALARTIVIEPQVLLLDEPLSNLDKNLRVQMREELLALQRRLGITTIFVTHDQEEAMTTADRMAVLDQGVVQQVGTPVELYDRPVNAFVATFVGTTNLLPARIRRRDAGGAELEVDGLGRLKVGAAVLAAIDAGGPGAGDGAAASAGAFQVSFRPQALTIAAPGTAAVAGGWTGVVERGEFLGEWTRYHLKVGPHRLIADSPHGPDSAAFAPGAAVGIGVDPRAVRVVAG